ncbi:hypothetical protein [Sphingomonas endolithica]|uniref:hypothetical protein n=1 Tax=Sphingomonas endolithica TaxID=2972485 RepID=UPI0021AE6991|nr:hypothetical protein [Sphingomonas sp. ZFBP2030]
MPLLTLVLVAAAGGTLPAEVKTLIERRAQCEHWAGEEPYDAARAAAIDAALRRLRCATSEADEARLRRRYARQRVVLAALDAGREE